MRMLHIACLPMPSPQGTQAVLRTMTEALARAGHETHLLTYGYGAGAALEGVLHHRCGRSGRGSMRSGPSWSKVRDDVFMVASTRRLVRRLQPEVVVAHNVEAALVVNTATSLLAVRPRTLYFAHTRFDLELPTYGRVGRAGAVFGRALDTLACRLDQVVAISPALGDHLGAPVVLPPWPVAAPISDDERRAARTALGLAEDEPVLLYAGNLDGYQGWEVAAAAAQAVGATWLVATESDPAPLRRFPHLRMRLATEANRRRAHAACDLALVPRRTPGGLPIKLLDALARDVPVVANRRALAGLSAAGVEVCVDDDVDAFAAAIRRALREPPRGGWAWVAETFGEDGFVRGLWESVS